MFEINGLTYGQNAPTRFIADIAANHDGDLERAIMLIQMAKDAGADVAKFQHFQAETIVSAEGFENLKEIGSHQANWDKSVFQVYKDASVPNDWTPILKSECDRVGITFMTTPYSLDIIDAIDEFVPAYKIGSGDITWLQAIDKIASKNKPYFIAAGASTLDEVVDAVSVGRSRNENICLMQCNTNYTGDAENFKFLQLNVLKTFRVMFPDVLLGLSDHTNGYASVLGAVTLGARVIEKHFTDDCSRAGPDHKFAMDPTSWSEMVQATRELESAMGDGVKKVEENEIYTVVAQRRGLYASKDIAPGEPFNEKNVAPLRPCPANAIPANKISLIIQNQAAGSYKAGDLIKWSEVR